jgi:hypothetical protein
MIPPEDLSTPSAAAEVPEGRQRGTMKSARTLFLGICCALTLGASVHAQQAAQVQQQSQQGAVEEFRRSQRFVVIPKLSADDREEFGEQVVLTEKPAQPILTLYTDNQLLFESNALLTRNNAESDALFISTTGFAIQPPLPEEYKKLILAFTGRFQAYRYDDHNELNFHIYTGGMITGYQVDDLLSVLVGNNYSAYYNEESYDHFFDETAHYVSVNRAFPIADDLAAYAGAQVQYRNTQPADFSRMEYDIFGGLRYALDPKWVAQIYARVEYQDYLASDLSKRHDWNLQPVLSLTYYFNEWLNARIIGHYTYNYSNLNVFHYQNFESGGAIAITGQF